MRKSILSTAGLFIVFGTFWACNSGDDVKEAENEVFAIHDEVMPKTGRILKLQKQLKQRTVSIDSLKATGSAATTLRIDEEKEQITRLSQNLKVADSLMMDWMSRYNGDTLTKISSEEALKYLAAQKDQITDVKSKVNSSIEQANQFLDKK